MKYQHAISQVDNQKKIIFGDDLIWRSHINIKFSNIWHFVKMPPIAPNFSTPKFLHLRHIFFSNYRVMNIVSCFCYIIFLRFYVQCQLFPKTAYGYFKDESQEIDCDIIHLNNLVDWGDYSYLFITLLAVGLKLG